MDGQQERSEELDLQLEAIQDVLALAQQEPGRDRQAEMVATAHRAFDAYARALAQLLREERAEEQPRPIFLLLKGGLGTVGAVLLAARIRTGGLWQSHQTAVLGGATGVLAAVVGLVLYLTLWDGPGAEVDGRAGGDLRPTAMAPVSTPTRTATPSAPSASSPAATPTPTPSTTGAPSTTAPAPSPTAVSAPMGDATTGPGPGTSSPGATPPPGSPGPSGSPGGTTPPPDGGTTTPPPGGEQSDGGRCAVTLPVPLVDIRLSNLLCL